MTLAIDRSTDATSVAVSERGLPARENAAGWQPALRQATITAKGGAWVQELLEFLQGCGVTLAEIDRFLVGCGPGSFAGTRAALAFCQGVVAARAASGAAPCPPDGGGAAPCPPGGGGAAPCPPGGGGAHGAAPLAARAIFGLPSGAGFAREGEKVAVVGDARRGLYWTNLWDGFREVQECRLVPASEFAKLPDYAYVTPDFARIGAATGAAAAHPSAATLLAVAEASPSLLVPEPLPIYLSPAVR